MNINNVKKSLIAKKIFWLNVVALAEKFRLNNITIDNIEQFIEDMRRFTLEYMPEGFDNPTDKRLHYEFKRLFDYYWDGIIEEYKLPKEEFLTSIEYHNFVQYNIKKKGLKAEEGKL